MLKLHTKCVYLVYVRRHFILWALLWDWFMVSWCCLTILCPTPHGDTGRPYYFHRCTKRVWKQRDKAHFHWSVNWTVISPVLHVFTTFHWQWLCNYLLSGCVNSRSDRRWNHDVKSTSNKDFLLLISGWICFVSCYSISKNSDLSCSAVSLMTTMLTPEYFPNFSKTESYFQVQKAWIQYL